MQNILYYGKVTIDKNLNLSKISKLGQWSGLKFLNACKN